MENHTLSVVFFAESIKTPTPADPINPCSTMQFLSLPIDPNDINHAAYLDWGVYYGISWFDVDPSFSTDTRYSHLLPA